MQMLAVSYLATDALAMCVWGSVLVRLCSAEPLTELTSSCHLPPAPLLFPSSLVCTADS